MEEEKKEESAPKNSNTLIIVIVSVIVAFAMGIAIGFLLFSDNKGGNNTNANTNSNENTNTNITPQGDGEDKELSDETKEELKKIALIDSGNEGLSPLYGKGGFISYFEDNDKLATIYFYAKSNGLTTTVTNEETDLCSGGSGQCTAISKENFKQIAKKYDLSDFVPDLKEYNGLYLFTYGGWIQEYSSIVHDYYFITTGPGADIIDNITYNYVNPNKPAKKEKREFTFHIDIDTYEYYLVSAYEIHDVE